MEAGTKLYELRMHLDLTLEQAAERIGIHKSTLCRYEQEMPKTIRPEVLSAICSLYQVTPEYFQEKHFSGGDCWYPILSPEEVAEAYRRLPERDRIRISRMLTIRVGA